MAWFVFWMVVILGWAGLALAALPERPDFSQIPIWRPRHPQVAITAGVVGLVGIFIIFQDDSLFGGQLWKALKDLAPEMVGLAFTVVVIDELNQLRIEQQRKQEILEQLHSPIRDVAVEALRLVRENPNGWSDDELKEWIPVEE